MLRDLGQVGSILLFSVQSILSEKFFVGIYIVTTLTFKNKKRTIRLCIHKTVSDLERLERETF